MTDGGHLDLELLAAQLRRHSDDLSMYAGFLLNVLSAALPPELVQVTREGKWKAKLAGREPAVLGISVTIDDRRYELERSGGGAYPTAKIRHESGGGVLSTRTGSAAEWAHGPAAAPAGIAGPEPAAGGRPRRVARPG